eukprot:TRINITY_DN1289_c0_g1_i2.p1 TRINITY_DN1289_c0_g1~~TRINITY_DN1289_c0_g1_i2.p1  ORF type:complete len:141 (-),score=42.55 TRINITY_DN1289_c0_g1_i2:248-649(-)
MPSTTDEIVISDGEHDLFNYGANPPGIDKFSSSEVVVSSSFHKTNIDLFQQKRLDSRFNYGTNPPCKEEVSSAEVVVSSPFQNSERKEEGEKEMMEAKPSSERVDGELDLFQQKRLDSRFNYGTNPPCKEEVS